MDLFQFISPDCSPSLREVKARTRSRNLKANLLAVPLSRTSDPGPYFPVQQELCRVLLAAWLGSQLLLSKLS